MPVLTGTCVCCGEFRGVDADDGHCARCATGRCGCDGEDFDREEPGDIEPDEGNGETTVSNGLNKVMLIGNLGKDPEVRYTNSGSAVCNMRLAVGERRKSGDTWEEHTEWIDLVCFGKTAENVGQYLGKGSQLHAEGRMQTRKWEDRDGNTRYSTEVVCQNVIFLSTKNSGAGAGNGRRDSSPAADEMPF